MSLRNAVVAFGTFILALSFTSAVTAGTVYDAANDFSVTNGNPNGTWSYGHDTGVLISGDPNTSTFSAFGSAFPNASGTGLDVWSNGGDPNVIHNPSSSPIVCGICGGQVWAPNELSWGPYMGPTVVRFTAPGSGLYAITASFHDDIQTFTNSPPDVYIYRDGTQLLKEAEVSGSYLPFSTTLSLTKNETIDFIAWGNDSNNRTIGLSATLTYTPEPASIVLFGLGAAGLLVAAGRRRKV